MKRREHIEAAKRIAADSWALLNFEQLPRSASAWGMLDRQQVTMPQEV